MDEMQSPNDGAEAAEAEAGGAAADPPAAGSAAALAAEVAALQARVEELRQESAERFAGWQRAQADYQNLKKRSQRGTQDRVHAAVAALLRDLLVVVDDFERALELKAGADIDGWVEGVRLIQRKFSAFLDGVDLHPIATLGQPFDPTVHEAVGRAAGPADRVTAEVQRGYRLGDQVLRPARVIIGDGTGADAPDDERDASDGAG